MSGTGSILGGQPVPGSDDPGGGSNGAGNGKMDQCLMDHKGGGGGHKVTNGGGGGWGNHHHSSVSGGGGLEESYPSLIFRLLDAAKPQSEGGKPKKYRK